MHLRHPVVLALITSMPAAGPVHAGECQDWHKGPMHEFPSGTQGVVFCSTTWDPDGDGPLPSMLFAGGQFSSIGGVTANNIAAWDGASWRPLIEGAINGIDAEVHALRVHDGALIVAGSFSRAGGGDNAEDAVNIARWDGQAWSPLGQGLLSEGSIVEALEVYDGELYAGGYFLLTGAGVHVSHMARWDGSAWQPVAGGVSGNPGPGYAHVRDLKAYNGELWVGGWFSSAGAVAAANIARWDGSAWLAAGGGLGSPDAAERVSALEIHNGQLYAAGSFRGSDESNNVAFWTGSTWEYLAGGVDGPDASEVFALKSYAHELYVGGNFTLDGGAPGNLIAKWDGTAWTSLEGFLSGASVRGLGLHAGAGALVVCGDFDAAGQLRLNSIGTWHGGAWHELRVPEPNVYCIANHGPDLAVGGLFRQSTSDAAPARNIARWDGARLHRLGSGMSGLVMALLSFTRPESPFATELIAGGEFSVASGVIANHVARWVEHDGGSPAPAWEPMGSGFNGAVRALVRHYGATYAGGDFTFSGLTAVDRIARWNEASGTWQPLADGGFNWPVYALASFGGFLYAGGPFTGAGGSAINYLAKWNGSSWTKVGAVQQGDQPFNPNGAGSGVHALAVHDNMLRIGGRFTWSLQLQSAINFVGWSGSLWSVPGANDTVLAFCSSGEGLYVGGAFTTMGGVNAERVARLGGGVWDEGGTDEPVHALASFRDEVHAGGGFGSVRNGTIHIHSAGWATYHETGVPWIVEQPQSADRPCGADFSPGVLAADGYGGQTQWRKDGVPLANGPTGTGSTVAGANGNLLLINVSDADEGQYDCVITNGCGSATSGPASLTVTGFCPPCLGDTNGDGLIGIGDLLALLASWGPCPAPPGGCLADIAPAAPTIGDGVVGIEDLAAHIAGWGACP